jgi:hypothetical protein
MWVVEIDEVERICHEIERTLNQKDMQAAVKVVREAFSRPRNALFVEHPATRLKSELVPLSSSGLVSPAASTRS